MSRISPRPFWKALMEFYKLHINGNTETTYSLKAVEFWLTFDIQISMHNFCYLLAEAAKLDVF